MKPPIPNGFRLPKVGETIKLGRTSQPWGVEQGFDERKCVIAQGPKQRTSDEWLVRIELLEDVSVDAMDFPTGTKLWVDISWVLQALPVCICPTNQIGRGLGCTCGAFKVEMRDKGLTWNRMTKAWEKNH